MAMSVEKKFMDARPRSMIRSVSSSFDPQVEEQRRCGFRPQAE